ncbi:MAG: CBS domain-containing protein [Labilithrix sp.]|nr:CBS domain-containing protein [Labilithrix sp.]MCW5812580.1 CBS domain-containing protein [Labilithrix sp.]
MKIDKLCSRDAVTVPPDAKVVDAARLMRSHHVGAVVVTNPDKRPMGILTDRDIVVGIVAKDVPHFETLDVRDVLTPDPIVALEHEDADAVLARMRRHGIRRVPVVDKEGHLIGVFALDDALTHLASKLGDVTSLLRAEQWREQQRRR